MQSVVRVLNHSEKIFTLAYFRQGKVRHTNTQIIKLCCLTVYQHRFYNQTYTSSFQKEGSLTEIPTSAKTSSVASSRRTPPDDKRHKSTPKTTKVLLEELYGDWQYLERILNEEGDLDHSPNCTVINISRSKSEDCFFCNVCVRACVRACALAHIRADWSGYVSTYEYIVRCPC